MAERDYGSFRARDPNWQLQADEVEERVAHLQRELEMVRSKNKQAKAKVSVLELCLQS